MNLTDTQIAALEAMIGRSTISVDEMREDILDHLCCEVEWRLEAGQLFDAALYQSLREFSPGGLNEIEKERFLLMNPKFIVMKKSMYVSGLICSMMIAVGFILKVMHLPLANELLIFGMGGFLFIFIPLLLITLSGRRAPRPSHVMMKDRLGVISAVLISAGGILKVLHLVTANETLILGFLVLSFGFLPYLFLTLYRESAEVHTPGDLTRS